MKPSDSNATEDNSSIYNSLPVELFTNEFEDEDIELEEDFDSDDKDFPADEIITDFRDLTRTHSPELPIEDELASLRLSEELLIKDLVPPKLEDVAPPLRSSSQSLPPVSAGASEETGLWIRCTRCGKKNDLDCNFCGKCGLQIHKVISIAETESNTETTNPEVVRNIKYHYKRPVFCFGPRGNCFASFSSPSKSVRNVVKFRLSTLPEFKSFLESQIEGKIISSEYDKLWTEDGFKSAEWKLKDGFLRSLCAILAGQSGFTLDEALRVKLLDFFASIAPKDLGSIKNLAVQDTVRYSRPDIDEIFHKLVLGQIREACEECITFNYWDHALIIAKTLDPAFYENVMNRFLNSRFAKGHPLRTLYLIMTANERSALEEIRGIIGDETTVSFVKDIWAVLGNFLLRAKPDASQICTIFEDIGNCLFDQKLNENALICYTIAILTGAVFAQESQIVNRVDFLLSWFLSNPEHDTIDFAGMRVVDLLTEKLSSRHSNTILWRCQFVKLLFAQFLYDMDSFDHSSLISLTQARKLGKSSKGYSKILAEECTILCARQVIDEEITFKQEKLVNAFQASVIKSSVLASPPQAAAVQSTFTPMQQSPSLGYEPVQFNDFTPAPELIQASKTESINSPGTSYSPVDDFISSKPKRNSIKEEPSPKQETARPQQSKHQNETEGGLLTKLKIWVNKNEASKNDPQKPVVAKMGKKNTLRYDAKLKKWVDDSDPSTMEETPKLPPPPMAKLPASTSSSVPATARMPTNPGPAVANTMSFRAKKGKLKYFDPLNPDADSAAPKIPSFNSL